MAETDKNPTAGQAAEEQSAKDRIIAIMRANAEAGVYDKFPELKAECLSARGYDPEVARACLSHHGADPVARNLLVQCDKHTEIWHSKLKSVEPDNAGGGAGGPPVFEVHVAPWAAGKPMDPTTMRCAAQEFTERGWTLTPPPEAERDNEDRCLMSWVETALKAAAVAGKRAGE